MRVSWYFDNIQIVWPGMSLIIYKIMRNFQYLLKRTKKKITLAEMAFHITLSPPLFEVIIMKLKHHYRWGAGKLTSAGYIQAGSQQNSVWTTGRTAAEEERRCSSDGSAVEVPPDSDNVPGSLAATTTAHSKFRHDLNIKSTFVDHVTLTRWGTESPNFVWNWLTKHLISQ